MGAVSLLVMLVVTSSVSAHVVYFDHDVVPGDGEFRDESTRKVGRGQALDTSDCMNVSPIPDDLRAEMPLDNFYQKYTHAYGIPIVSSNQPNDDALIRACYVVRFMLADRKDVRDSMFDSYGRVGVIGYHEKTLDIPEHSYLPSWWNDRARGFGGTASRPIATDGEENILCWSYWKDRWNEEDVLVHEFAHSVHLISMTKVDRTFNGRLKAAWNEAKAAGLWQNTYAISHYREYFAEGVQAYYNCQTHRDDTDGLHNHVSTRDALSEYDPKLFSLIAEVFPCKQDLISRCEKNNKELTSAHELLMDC
ncbi:uncharacterized protein LOC117295895 [Asterias rubens]|uniref:uncharacterized protein LOC117295895 n=1 Tax=Asterias rubens TaxID=7604 RepID=UPI00145503B1|nr:uncharacterized protein LOC117295895 [Asterias rubens]